MGVFLSYVTTQGHALIDRDLYLPEDWLSDRERCSEAGIADTVPFRPKWELALEMLKRAREAGLPMHWVVADTVYGQAVDLRNWLEQHGYAFVLAIACNEPVCVATTERWMPACGSRSGRCHPPTQAGLAAAQHEPGDQRTSAL